MAQTTLAIDIELRPHVGVCVKEGVPIEVEHDQWIVVGSVNGGKAKEWGYIRKAAEGKFCPLNNIRERTGDWLYNQIAEAVTAAHQAKVSGNSE